jgi:hypothetical protein
MKESTGWVGAVLLIAAFFLVFFLDYFSLIYSVESLLNFIWGGCKNKSIWQG